MDARVELDLDVDLSGIDIVHGFSVYPSEVHQCRTRGLPVVISPIFWDIRYGPDGYFTSKSIRSILGSFRLAGRFLAASLRNGTRLAEACLAQVPWEREKLAAYEAADLLLPNSDGESESIRRDLGVTTPMMMVPNGVDPERFNQVGVPFNQRDTVLSVGRIDPHKNQLGLIRALRGSGKKLVIVGYEHPDHGDYADECRSSGAGWVDFIDGMPHDELRKVFAQARVHALPSWFETTGLVSLEAALSGCGVVSTDRGHAHEYLGNRAMYCDPADVKSIRHAVEMAWQRDPSPDLRQYVLDHFTWDHVARATREAYETVLERRHSPGSVLQAYG